MKRIIFLLFFLISSIYSYDYKEQLESTGFINSPQKIKDKIIFTDDLSSKIYLLEDNSLNEILSSPGIGRYYSISFDKNIIGYKYIDEKTGKQVPALYFIDSGKIEYLSKPVTEAGQVSFSENGDIAYTIGNVLIVENNNSKKEYDLGYYANLAPISPNGKYVCFNNADDDLFLYDLKNKKIKQITKTDNSFFNPQWSFDSKKIAFTSISGDVFAYHLDTKKMYNIDKGLNPQWNEKSTRIYYEKRTYENLTLKNSDIAYSEYSKVNDEYENSFVTQTENVFEMEPQYHNNSIVYHTFLDREIIEMSLKSKTKEKVFKADSPLELKYFTVKMNTNEEKLNISVPYIHQVYDTPDGFDHAYGCCATTTCMMVFAHYQLIPHWDAVSTRPYSHTTHWGRFISQTYHYFDYTYTDGGDTWMWDGGSPNSKMRNYISQHGLSSTQDWSVSFTELSNELNNGYPYPLCVMLTSAGHLIAAKGIYVGHAIYFNDPYGNKNTAGYPSYDGADAIYDWPGYNNGFVNLSSVAWAVTGRGSYHEDTEELVDDFNFSYSDNFSWEDYSQANPGFYLHTVEPDASMRYWRSASQGNNNDQWWTYTVAGDADYCYAAWKPNLEFTGNYDVKVYIPSSNNDAVNARYNIYYEGGSQTVEIDQTQYSDEWVTLGNFYFTSGHSHRLTMGDGSSTGSQKLVFDAVEFVYTEGDEIVESEFPIEIKNNLSVKSAPSPEADEICSANAGEKYITIAHTESGWYKIYIPSGTGEFYGWIYGGDSFSESNIIGSPLTGFVECTTPELNVRAGASTSYDIITTISEGQKFAVIEHTKGWYKFYILNSSGHTFGWASEGSSSQYLDYYSSYSGGVYGAELVSVNAPESFDSDETGSVNFSVKNIGDSPWGENIFFALSNPAFHSSEFAHDSWISDSRVTALDGVLPGQTYDFSIIVQAPEVENAGYHTEYFNFYVDGCCWFSESSNLGPNDNEIYFTSEVNPIYVPEPEIVVSPLSLSFSDTEVGEISVVKTFEISNTGDAVLNISSITSCSGFQIELDSKIKKRNRWSGSIGSFSINAGSSKTVNVIFSPSVSGSFTGNIEIASDDSDEPLINVAVTGQGLEPVSDPFGEPVVYPNTPMTVYGEVFIDGVYASNGDIVGAFSGTELRGKREIVIGKNYKAAYVTLNVNIASEGEAISFKIYDESEDEIRDASGSVTGSIGGTAGSYPDDLIPISAGNIVQNIELSQGWNLISFNVKAADMTPQSVFSSISSELMQVKSLISSYDPELPAFMNTLTELNNQEGYWVEVSGNVVLSISGVQCIPINHSISLSSGWNLVGYPCSLSQTPETAFSSLSGNIVQVKSLTQSYDPALPEFMNTLDFLEPGKGYWLEIAEDAEFTYPE